MDSPFEADVNYLAVILAALAAQALGFLWYGPLFGGRWMALRGYSEADVRADASPMVYILPLLAAIVIAYVLARLVDMAGADSVGDCIAVAVFAWSGFTATATAMQINFSPHATNKPLLFAVEGGYYLALFLIAGAIIGAFQ
jgi:hypothetical protein